MRFSIIMPSYLGNYPNAAKNREQKIVRAVESVLGQSFEDWELIIVADGCQKTAEIIKPFVYEYLPKIRLLEIPKYKTWAGAVRNAGIFKAEGEIITYLDIDDYLGSDHLKLINDGFAENDWVFFNDLNYDVKKGWYENLCSFEYGKCGTSNIAHKRSLGAYWTSNNYAHDFVMIGNLKGMSKNFTHIGRSEYYVAHIPNRYDI